MSAWRENIERVREALKIATMNNTYVHLTHPEAQGVLDALTALTAQIEALNGENASLNAENRDLLEKWSARGAQMKELERERDSLVKQSLAQGAWMEGAMPNFSEVAEANARATAAEQRVKELEKTRNVVGTEGGTAREGTAGRCAEAGSVGSGASLQSEVGADDKAKEWRDIADEYLSQRKAAEHRCSELWTQAHRAEQRVEELEESLRAIMEVGLGYREGSLESVRALARAALAQFDPPEDSE